MRKRERESPCRICGHYHKYEEGEVCNICGHKLQQQNTNNNPSTTLHVSAFPTEILHEFMYLGTYHNASRSELLKTQSISRILNITNLPGEIMSKRKRACDICHHYHNYEEGEVCGICGHFMPSLHNNSTSFDVSIYSTEILPNFLYLGSRASACRWDLMKIRSISRFLDTVPSCQNLYRNSFTYHCLQDDKTLQFDDAIQFLDQCENDRARVLVHCMTGKSRSPAVVIAYLMKKKGWKLAQSYQWVKERRPSVEVAQAYYEQLQQYEQMIFGSNESTSSATPFGFPKSEDPVSVPVPVPAFSNLTAPSIFSRPALDVPPHEFTFGAGPVQQNPPPNQNPNDISMDSS